MRGWEENKAQKKEERGNGNGGCIKRDEKRVKRKGRRMRYGGE